MVGIRPPDEEEIDQLEQKHSNPKFFWKAWVKNFNFCKVINLMKKKKLSLDLGITKKEVIGGV